MTSSQIAPALTGGLRRIGAVYIIAASAPPIRDNGADTYTWHEISNTMPRGTNSPYSCSAPAVTIVYIQLPGADTMPRPPAPLARRENHMAQPAPSPADRLERLAAELHELAFDVREQRSASDYERNEEEAQRIAASVRAVFRG